MTRLRPVLLLLASLIVPTLRLRPAAALAVTILSTLATPIAAAPACRLDPEPNAAATRPAGASAAPAPRGPLPSGD